MYKICFLLSTFLFSINAMAATVKSNKEVLHLDDVLKKGSYKTSITTSMGSANIYGSNLDILSMKPTLTAKFKNFEGIFTLPFSWVRSPKSTNNNEESRYIGRPELIAKKQVKQVKNTTVSVAGSLKLPMTSAENEPLADLNRGWQFSPILSTRTITSKKVDVIIDGALEYNTETSAKNFTLNRPLTARVAAALEYKYDKKITVGTGVKGSSVLGKYSLKVKSGSFSSTVDSASRDRISLGVFGHYEIDKNSRVVASFYSALKNEDSMAGTIAIIDNPQESSKISATVGLEKAF